MPPGRFVQFSQAIVLAAPPHEVYDYLANAAQWRHWHPASQFVSDAPAGPLRLGDRVTQRIRVALRQFDAVWQVTEQERPGRLRLETQAPQGDAAVTYALAPLGEGCRLERRCEFRMHGPWRLFDGNLTRWLLRRQARQALANLHAHFL